LQRIVFAEDSSLLSLSIEWSPPFRLADEGRLN
jgi:hypothetical protein